MNKTIFMLIAISIMAFSASTYAAVNTVDPIPLEGGIIDPTNDNDGPHKGPVQVPEVSLDDHTLYFFTPCDGCTLNLVDENDDVVYTLVIPSGTTSLALPSDLSGEFELQIIRGNYCFWGTITL